MIPGMSQTPYSKWLRLVALIAIGAGVAARTIYFGSNPPGLNQDETSIGYEAWSLLHYGTDRYGLSWPVHLINFGNGGNASYAYAAMPFVIFGLSPLTIRMPMLVTALASLPLVWFIARRLFGEESAWAATAVVALSPWHIMLSRWALEGNILPFLFLCGLALLVYSVDTNRRALWLAIACATFGVSVYSYGPGYVAVPLFVIGALLVGLSGRIFTVRQAALGALVFAIATAPIALYVLVNFFQWNTIHLGGITVPRLPVTASFESKMSEGGLLTHVEQFLLIMVLQRDGSVHNVTDPYGVLYSGIFFALALGFVVATPVRVFAGRAPLMRLLVPLWVVACIPTGVFQMPNINRLNLLLMGMVVAAGLALGAIEKKFRGAVVVGVLSMSVPFGFFLHDYFTSQRDRLVFEFVDGLLPALKYAQANTSQEARICVTGRVNMPQVYALFSETRDPREYARSVKYIKPNEAFRPVASYGRYTFGLERCDLRTAKVVVARRIERVQEPFRRVRSFGIFDVYAAPDLSTRVAR